MMSEVIECRERRGYDIVRQQNMVALSAQWRDAKGRDQHFYVSYFMPDGASPEFQEWQLMVWRGEFEIEIAKLAEGFNNE